MTTASHLKAVKPQEGKPLYLSARDVLRKAIDEGAFRPGERLPSTKTISQQLRVSLVTTHRAMQDLVASGRLRRAKGRGTFVYDDLHDRLRKQQVRIGMLFHPEASLADYHHSLTVQGARQAARERNIDLVLPRFDEQLSDECQGYLLFSPQVRQINILLERARSKPFIVAGSVPVALHVPHVKIDNRDISRKALDHLCNLGHRRIGYIGMDDNALCGRERWLGFLAGCAEHSRAPREEFTIRCLSNRLDDRERMALVRMLTAPESQRPTAIIASGFWFAMDIYNIVIEHGICVPKTLSILGVDDPPGAANLSPPLTTFSRPLMKLGYLAATSLLEMIKSGTRRPANQVLQAELIIRGSTGPAH